MKLLWILICFFSVLLLFMGSQYLTFETDVMFLNEKQNLIHDSIYMSVFYTHVISGMICMLVGPIQFVPWVRRKFRLLHKMFGKIYLGAILILAAPTGLYMAFHAEGGPMAAMGFIAMSFVWWVVTYTAFDKIKEGHIEEHKAWMMRSMAVSCAALTLRIMVPIMSHFAAELSDDFITDVTAWASWMFNLLLAEIIILYSKNSIKPLIV